MGQDAGRRVTVRDGHEPRFARHDRGDNLAMPNPCRNLAGGAGGIAGALRPRPKSGTPNRRYPSMFEPIHASAFRHHPARGSRTPPRSATFWNGQPDARPPGQADAFGGADAGGGRSCAEGILPRCGSGHDARDGPSGASRPRRHNSLTGGAPGVHWPHRGARSPPRDLPRGPGPIRAGQPPGRIG